MKLSLWRANPAGNVTLLVKSAVPREKYAGIANALLAKKELSAEQVAFITPPKAGSAGRIEMMGGEFCGNAARSFGFLCAQLSEKRPGSVFIEISGAKEPVKVEVDLKRGESFAAMPLPGRISEISFSGESLCIVELEGIAHAIACGAPREEKDFVLPLARRIIEEFNAQAAGVMVLEGRRLIPAVYVKETASLVWEGSCGSGSCACAACLVKEAENGESSFVFEQPGGSIAVTAQKQDGELTRLRMGGAVSLSKLLEIEV